MSTEILIVGDLALPAVRPGVYEGQLPSGRTVRVLEAAGKWLVVEPRRLFGGFAFVVTPGPHLAEDLAAAVAEAGRA